MKARCWCGLLFVLTCFCLIGGYFLQYGLGWLPCPLCIMQRLVMIGIACASLIGLMFPTVIHGVVYIVWQVMAVGCGFFFTLRQLWIQHQPVESAFACMPGLDVLIKYFSFSDVLHALFWGGSECAKTPYQLLGFSLATWSLLYFMCAAVFLLKMYRET